jgi:hypothetical protein
MAKRGELTPLEQDIWGTHFASNDFKEVMKLRSAYNSGIKNVDTVKASSVYIKFRRLVKEAKMQSIAK